MTAHIFQPQARITPQVGVASRQSQFGWLRRMRRFRARVRQQQQQPTVAPTPVMTALYTLALTVVDEYDRASEKRKEKTVEHHE